MMQEYIDADTLRQMFVTGMAYLNDKKDWINELNVFPVPDGDTGTNMTLTLQSAVKELQTLPGHGTMEEIGRRIASGTLRGARGNSGVILSQLCRGFISGIRGAERIQRDTLVEGFQQAVKTAYQAVMDPREGTILTVARGVSEKARELMGTDASLETVLKEVFRYAEEVLQKTPEMLPVLKEAGVVDSGGQGLVEFLRGAKDVYLGTVKENLSGTDPVPVSSGKEDFRVDTSHLETSDIRFVYCTEFIIETDRAITQQEEQDLKEYYSSIGDSLVCVSMDGLVKIHVHTNHPGDVIERALTLGQLTNLKIDNMRYEHHERLLQSEDAPLPEEESAREPEKNYGFVTVCSGDGLAGLFQELNVDEIIEGGQTMNPSTEDFLAAVRKVPAKYIFLLPNNSNILLAAQQARDICSEKQLIVIPTKNICEGISAMIAFDPQADLSENERNMTGMAEQTRCGEVTYAIRDTSIGGSVIKKGDYMGISGGKLLTVSGDVLRTVTRMVMELAADGADLVTLYYGADTDETEAEAISASVCERLPETEVAVVYGGQQVYRYIISVE